MLRAQALGPLTLTTHTGQITLGGRLARRLVSALVLRAGDFVTDETLATALWGEHPPQQYSASLHAYISRLRTSLGEARTRLSRSDDGYRLDVDELDVTQFEAQLTAAIRQLRTDPYRTVAEAREALRLWRGEPFTDLADADIAQSDRDRLADLHADAIEVLIEARLGTGDALGVIADAQRATRDAPYRERRWELLVLALYRSGRQAEALNALRSVKTLLADELGIDPGPALRQLEGDVLTAAPSLLVTVPASSPAPVAEARRDSTVPVPLTSFRGRTAELAEVDEAFEQGRLVTLLGPGGVGKTRLAVEWAAATSEHVWFAPLVDTQSSEHVSSAVAKAFGVANTAGDAVSALHAALDGRSGTLILDNCEHLTAVLPQLVVALLVGSTGLRVLTTSREPLGIDGENLYTVLPLPTEDGDQDGPAVELLVDRVRAVRGKWAPSSQEMSDLRRVCAALDGFPLAIELAAARARVLSIVTITDSLDGRFSTLASVPAGSVAAHPDLAATIAWSVDALPPKDRRVLESLWPFRGGFDVELAIAANPDMTGNEVLLSLSSLVSKSLVAVDTSAASMRYRLWETVRLFIRETDTATGRHEDACAEAIRERIEQQGRLLGTPTSRHAMVQLERDLPNLRYLMDRDLTSEPERGLHTLVSVEWFWFRTGRFAEGLQRARTYLAAATSGDRVDRARAWGIIAVLSGSIGDPASAAHALTAARAELRDLHPEPWYAGQLSYLSAILLTITGRTDEAEQQARDAIRIGEETGTALTLANGLMQLGVVMMRTGRREEGARFLDRAARVTERASPWTAGMASLHLSRELLATDPDNPAISPALDRAVRIFLGERDLNSLAVSLLLATQHASASSAPVSAEVRATVVSAAREMQLPIDALNQMTPRDNVPTEDPQRRDADQRLLDAAHTWLMATAQH